MARKALSETDRAIIRQRINCALEFQDWFYKLNMGDGYGELENRVERNLAVLRGDYWQQVAGQNQDAAVKRGSNKILPKLVAKQAMLTQGSTEFYGEALDERFLELAKEAAAQLNNEWELQQVEKEVAKARWDSESAFFGVVETGWLWVRGEETIRGGRGEEVEPELPEDAVPIMVADQMMQPIPTVQEFGSPEEAEAALRQERVADDRKRFAADIDDPYVERFSPKDLLIDPNCRSWDLSDARFVCRVRREYVEDVKSNRDYRNTKDLAGSSYTFRDTLTGGGWRTGSPEIVADAEIVTLYDCWTFLGKGSSKKLVHVVVAESGVEDAKELLYQESPYLDDNEVPLFVDNPFPYCIIPGLVVDNDCPYPESSVEQALPLQLAFDESWEQLNEHRRKSNRQYAYPKGMLDENAIAKIEQGKDLALIEVDAALKDQITPLYPHIPVQPEVIQSIELIDPEINRALGVNEFMESITPQRDLLKVEVEALHASGGTRLMGDAETYREFRQRVGMRILLLLQRFADRARPYNYTTPDGEARWGAMNAADLRGTRSNNTDELEDIGVQYMVKLNADNAGPLTKIQQRKSMSELLAVLMRFASMPDLQAVGPVIQALGEYASGTQNPRVMELVKALADGLQGGMVNLKPVLRSVVETYGIMDLDSIFPTPGAVGGPASPPAASGTPIGMPEPIGAMEGQEGMAI